MFGYSNDLRSMTQGKGSFSMEFLKYQKLPSRFQEEIVKKAQPRQGHRQGLSGPIVTILRRQPFHPCGERGGRGTMSTGICGHPYSAANGSLDRFRVSAFPGPAATHTAQDC